jgi:hypothetical protein
MTPAHWVALLSAVLGAAGTVILFFGSYSLEPREGAVWGVPKWTNGTRRAMCETRSGLSASELA